MVRKCLWRAFNAEKYIRWILTANTMISSCATWENCMLDGYTDYDINRLGEEIKFYRDLWRYYHPGYRS